MKMNKIALGLAAVALVAAPAVAQVAMSPAVAPLTGDETGLEGEGIVIGIVAAAAVVGAIVVASSSNDNEVPVSG